MTKKMTKILDIKEMDSTTYKYFWWAVRLNRSRDFCEWAVGPKPPLDLDDISDPDHSDMSRARKKELISLVYGSCYFCEADIEKNDLLKCAYNDEIGNPNFFVCKSCQQFHPLPHHKTNE